MSKYEKLVKDLENSPNDVKFEVLKKLFENVGYKATNNGSSHWQFRKEDKDTLTIPYKRPIKAIYVKKVIKDEKERLKLLYEFAL